MRIIEMNNLIELHLHLDGALSIDNCKKLAKLQGITIPENDDEMRDLMVARPNCHDLNEFLTKFDFAVSLMQTLEGIKYAIKNLQEELIGQGIIYAEIRFAPQIHTRLGLTQNEVVQAAIEGINASPLRSNLILCCVRGDQNHAENMETVRIAKEFLRRGVCAIDLAGAEGLFPTKNFEDIFVYAKDEGIPFTIHAGEADGPDSIRDAVRFGAKRIGHGIRASEDSEFVRMLAEHGITLEICPTSNLYTTSCRSVSELPLKKFIESGVNITINTDDPTVCQTTLRRELELVANAFSLSRDELVRFQLNAVDASFLDQSAKDELIRKIHQE